MSNSPELCFVLKSIPIRERDLVVTLFSESRGRFSGIARNGVSSKRFGGSLGLFTASLFDIDQKTTRLNEMGGEALVGLNSAIIKHEIKDLGKSFEKLSAASSFNEIVMRTIPEHRSVPDVFKLYSNALFALSEVKSEQSIALVNAFILKITQWLGVQPSLTRCLICERTLNEVPGDEVLPQVARGGWICVECSPKNAGTKENRLSKTIMLDAYHSMLNPIRKIEFSGSLGEHETLLEYLEKHLSYFVPGLDKAPITSLRFLKSISL